MLSPQPVCILTISLPVLSCPFFLYIFRCFPSFLSEGVALRDTFEQHSNFSVRTSPHLVDFSLTDIVLGVAVAAVTAMKAAVAPAASAASAAAGAAAPGASPGHPWLPAPAAHAPFSSSCFHPSVFGCRTCCDLSRCFPMLRPLLQYARECFHRPQHKLVR